MARFAAVLLSLILLGSTAHAVESPVTTPPPETDPSIGGLFYLGYQVGETQDVEFNQFFVRRAYLTVKKSVLPFLDARITLDTSQDLEGDGRGDMEVRLKYALGKFSLPSMGPVTHQSLEVGIVHGPWLAFEETVNRYRMRDKMFIERSGIINSADFGVTWVGWLGEPLDSSVQERVGKKFAGRYGSFALGVYNGGGYHAVEENTDNVFEARLSLRPLVAVLPGLQLSGFGVIGKGNSSGPDDEIPDWNAWLAMLSYQHPRFTLAAQYLNGDGNQKGSWVQPQDPRHSLEYEGYSLFGEWVALPKWRLIGGYDYFDGDRATLRDEYIEWYAGLGYDFGQRTILLADYTVRDYDAPSLDQESMWQLTLQIAY